MSTISFCMQPRFGPMSAALNLAKTLRQWGHTVSFFGMSDCQPFVEPYGFEFVPAYDAWFPKGYIQRWDEKAPSMLRTQLNLRNLVMESKAHFKFLIKGGHREFQAVVDQVKPDLFVLDGSHRPTWALLAYKYGVKSVYIHTNMPLSAAPNSPPVFTSMIPGQNGASPDRIRRVWRTYFIKRYVNHKLYALFGIGYDWMILNRKLARICGYPVHRINTQTMISALLDFPELILYPQPFEFPDITVKNRYYVDPCIDFEREEGAFPWEQIDANKKLIYCSLGSIHHNQRFFQTVLEAVSKEPNWQLVLSVGARLNTEAFSTAPIGSIIVNNAPQLQLLQKADAMITHGGINSIKECIFFKVPMVVFPITFDQPGAAARVQYHGLGEVGDIKKVTAETLHGMLNNVLSEPSLPARIASMSEIFKTAEAEQQGAKLLETLAVQSA